MYSSYCSRPISVVEQKLVDDDDADFGCEQNLAIAGHGAAAAGAIMLRPSARFSRVFLIVTAEEQRVRVKKRFGPRPHPP